MVPGPQAQAPCGSGEIPQTPDNNHMDADALCPGWRTPPPFHGISQTPHSCQWRLHHLGLVPKVAMTTPQILVAETPQMCVLPMHTSEV